MALANLPQTSEILMNAIVVEALVVSTPDTLVRILLGDHCLDFAPDDVLDFEELAPPPRLVAGSARFAKITIRAGAKLYRISSAEQYKSALWIHREPFVLATRRVPIMGSDWGLTEKEDAYFRARGLTVNRDLP